MSRNLICATLAGALLAAPATAQYQMMSPMLYEGPRIALQDHANRSQGGTMPMIGRLVSNEVRLARNGSMPQVVNNAALIYSPSLERRRANYAQFVAKSRDVDPAGAASLERDLAKTDFVAAMKPVLAKQGLRIDNVADAYAVWWLQAWQAAHGDLREPDRAMLQPVKAQAARAILSSREYASASDATKQEVAEAFLVQALLISAAFDQMKSDPGAMRKLGAAVRQGAKATGVDLDTMTLTAQGFVLTGKTGAAEPKSSGKSNSKLALALAAGSVGLGGAYALGKAMGRKG